MLFRSIEAQGFAKWERAGVKVSAGDRRSVADIVLGTTAVTATTEITATADSIAPVDNGEKSLTLTNKQITNLSLVGRNASELIKALPGFAPVTGLDNKPGYNGEAIGINGNGDGGKQSPIGNFSANGTRSDALDIVADGAHISDPGCNCATPININPDMVEEFKVSTSNFGADVSKARGVERHLQGGRPRISRHGLHPRASLRPQFERLGQQPLRPGQTRARRLSPCAGTAGLGPLGRQKLGRRGRGLHETRRRAVRSNGPIARAGPPRSKARSSAPRFPSDPIPRSGPSCRPPIGRRAPCR